MPTFTDVPDLKPRGFYKMPTGAIADTFDRTAILASQTPVSGTLHMTAIELRAGQIVSNFSARIGGTGLATGTNQWIGLYDSGGVQLAVTADQALATITALTGITWPVATIASGAASSYTVPTTGLYYVGMMLKGGTMPSMAGMAGNTYTLTPYAAATADTAQSSVKAFPFTAAAFTASALTFYIWIS